MWNLIVSLLIVLLRTAALYFKYQPAKYLTVKQFKPSVKRLPIKEQTFFP